MVEQPARVPLRDDVDQALLRMGGDVDRERAGEQLGKLLAILLRDGHGFGEREVHAGPAAGRELYGALVVSVEHGWIGCWDGLSAGETDRKLMQRAVAPSLVQCESALQHRVDLGQ